MQKVWSFLFGKKPDSKSYGDSKHAEIRQGSTSFAEPMKRIVDQLADQLKEAGFKRKRNAFNRSAQDGMVHQISFDLIPAWSIGHGCFTLHGGVRVPANDLYKGNAPKSDWINSYDCSIRAIFGPDKITQGHHAWLAHSASEIVDDCRAAVTRCIGILDRYPNSKSVLSQVTPPEPLFHETPRGILVACILLDQGDRSEAERTLQQYISAESGSSAPVHVRNHLDHVLDWAARLGLNVSNSKP